MSVDSSGAQANGYSAGSTLSADGRFVSFTSAATNLVPADANASTDVFVHDRQTGATERVSVDSNGGEGNGPSYSWASARISGDGSKIVFTSDATNLVSSDTNGRTDIFVRDRATGTTTRVSVDSTGIESDLDSYGGSISEDGNFVVFDSDATNLVPNDTNGGSDIFVRDLTAGTTERVSVDSSGAQAIGESFEGWISKDGRFVVFSSRATNLVAGDHNWSDDVFLRDRLLGTTERVSVDSSGVEANVDSRAGPSSADGQVVVFFSFATNLDARDTTRNGDIYIRDRVAGTTVLVSVDSAGTHGNGESLYPFITSDGRSVAFTSVATNLVAGDQNSDWDAFVHNRSTGVTTRVSVDSVGVEGNHRSVPTGISADGFVVSIDSGATNLVASDTNGFNDCFVHDECSLAATWTQYGAGFPGTYGAPSFTSRQFPAFRATITVDLANSLGAPTLGLLVLGFQQASVPTKFGGVLRVAPASIQPITFSSGGVSFTGTMPGDVDLCGATLDLQGIELDPGAAFGVSFSPGLELTIGR